MLYGLSTGSGDGDVTLGVDGYGSFGLETFFGGSIDGTATYDPIGPIGAASTTFESGVAFRLGASGPRQFLTSGSIGASGGLPAPTVTGTTTNGSSSFTLSGLRFDLTQTVAPMFNESNARTGSLLTQSFNITNVSASSIDFELLRYMDGDLEFDNSLVDGGGRLFSSGHEFLFETDAGGTGSTDTTFLGIDASGGTTPSSSRFEIDQFPLLRSNIIAGAALTNTITGDGNNDGFIDAGSEYDVTLALRNVFTIGAGSSAIYTTRTVFGSGTPSDVSLQVPTVSVGDVSQAEGDSGTTDLVFTVSLSQAPTSPLTVEYATADGTAVAPTDYQAASGTLTFQPGDPLTQNVTIQVVGDTVAEANETFFLRLSNVVDGNLGDAEAVGTILNDDVDITISDTTVIEGNAGTSNAVLTLSTIGTHNGPVFVNYQTANGTASGGDDYLPRSGIVDLSSGSASITVPIVGDRLNEGTESFFVMLSQPVNGRIAKNPGIVTIIDDDPVPALYVDDVQLTATQAGLAAVFSVGLDVRSGREVTVQYATSDFTAHDGIDYLGASGTLTFAAGVNTLQVTVPVMTDPTYAPNEQFYFDLSNPVGATVADGHGVANIVFAAAIPAQYILDDGEAGYQQNYGWTNVTNLAGYHMDYDWHPAGTGVGFAQWGLSNLPAGNYQVFTRWVPFSNRATNAPYTILDGANVRGTVLVNQQIAPVGDRNDGVTWQSLGTFPLATGTLRVRLTDNANGYVVADAVRIVPVGIPPQVPEIDVASASHSIAVGDDSPSADDGTDFGTITAGLGSVTHTFTISNTGNADLHLLGTPRVQISGADAGDFSVVAQPDFTVAAGRTTTFQVKFQPTTGGSKQATLSIASDDADEGTYNFDIAGNADGAAPLAHNAVEPLDVNDDQIISARDALIVINALIKTTAASGPSATPSASTVTVTPAAADALYYIDVDGDGLIAPHDALLVINYLIHHPPTVSPAVAAPGDATPQVQAFATTDEAIAQLTSTSSAPAAAPLPASTQSASTAAPSASQTLGADAVTAAFHAAVPEDNDNSLDSLIG